MDEALVPHAHRLRIGRSNFCLLSDISSKESTLQLVYDVLRLTPFFKAFLVTTDVLEIYMQVFWAIATVHHYSTRFKLDNKKHIVNLESFKEMLHICPRLPGQSFVEPPFEEEIMAFLRFLRHSGAIRRLTDVNINKLHQPWRLFAAIVNKCLTGKSSGYDSLRLNIKIQRRAMGCIILGSQRNSDAYKECYAVATGATPPKTKASVQKTKSSSDTTVTPPPTAVVAMTEAQQLKRATKRSLQQTHISQASGFGADEGTGDDDDDDDEGDDGDDGEEGNDDDDDARDDDAQNDDDQEDEGNDEDDQEEGSDDEKASAEEEFIHSSLSTHDEEETRDEESFDPIRKMLENTDDEGNGEENLGMNVGREEGQDEKDEVDELYKDVNINIGRALSTLLQDLPNFGSLFGFDHRLKTLEANFSEFIQTNQFARFVSSIPKIVQRYIDQWMNEAVKVAVQIQSDQLRDEAQAKNDQFLKTIDENMKKIIKEQVKEQIKRNLYKALVKAYESDKIILDTYRDTITLKRRHDNDADKDKEPSVGSDRGSKRPREGNEPKLASAPKEKATRKEPMHTTFEMEEPSHPEFETGANDQPIVEPSQLPEWFSQQKPPTLDHDWNKTFSSTHSSIQPWISELAKLSDSRYSFNELMDIPADFSTFLMNWLKVDTLTLELLAGPTYELMKGSCKSLVGIEFFLEEVYKATTDQLDWVTLKLQQACPLGNLPLKITLRKDDDKLYKFKERDFKRLRIQDIEDMLLLLVQGKLTNLTVEERFAFNVSLRMFTRSIVIQRRVEDLQLGVKSYQKKLNLTRPNTYHSDIKCKEAYIAYSNPRGFIYQNKDRQNWLMRIDELHKFSDGTLTDVRTALDDHLKGIRMKYLPQTI
uniref:Uncharacterized protein n=1 Tax=Tanacetum cinerariifolium TaxID=118510 RepID=A0A6L2MB65_TANCI|nr:hypothetical protein [Tanacetum cinerariifolium]